MPKYLVYEPLNHDQKEYAPGSSVEMTAEQAAALLPLGVIEEVPAGKK
jgi:hypothetical protein